MFSIVIKFLVAIVLIEALGIVIVGSAYVIEMYLKEIYEQRRNIEESKEVKESK